MEMFLDKNGTSLQRRKMYVGFRTFCHIKPCIIWRVISALTGKMTIHPFKIKWEKDISSTRRESKSQKNIQTMLISHSSLDMLNFMTIMSRIKQKQITKKKVCLTLLLRNWSSSTNQRLRLEQTLPIWVKPSMHTITKMSRMKDWISPALITCLNFMINSTILEEKPSIIDTKFPSTLKTIVIYPIDIALWISADTTNN